MSVHLSEEQRLMRQTLPRLCRRRRHAVHPHELAARVADGPRRPPAARNSRRRRRRSASARSACRRSSAASNSTPATEVQTFALIAEEIARGDSGLADKLVQNWKVSVLLRNLRAAPSAGEAGSSACVEDPQFLLAHCLTEPRGASDRWLPYNVPEAAMQTRAVRAQRRLGDQRPQAVHLQRLRRRPLCRLRQHQPEGRHAAGHVDLSWCRARRPA